MLPPPPRSTLFPYTTLFRSVAERNRIAAHPRRVTRADHEQPLPIPALVRDRHRRAGEDAAFLEAIDVDRKSTRLNSSHPSISYAVFCLKKKKKQDKNYRYMQ